MKQLSLALEQYSQDSDNGYPPIAQPAIKHTWREAIYPFVKFSGVYRCPDDAYRADQYLPDSLPRSYAANPLDWGKYGNENRVITAVDVRDVEGPEWDMTNPAFAPPSSRALYTHKPHHIFYERRIGTLNCLFDDGHVKAMQPERTLSPLNLWTRDNAPFTGQDLTNAQAILRHAEQE